MRSTSTSSGVIATTSTEVWNDGERRCDGVEIPTIRSTYDATLRRQSVSVVQVSTEAVALKGSWNKTGSASD